MFFLKNSTLDIAGTVPADSSVNSFVVWPKLRYICIEINESHLKNICYFIINKRNFFKHKSINFLVGAPFLAFEGIPNERRNV